MATREEEALQRVASDPRRQFGWGPSALASQEEKEAYQAYQMLPQVQAGTLPVSALPEAYGGRPTGTSRRAIRMQAAYDAEQAARIQQEQAMRQEAEFMRQQERNAKVEEREAWRFEKEKRADAANVKLEALAEREAAEEEAEVDAIATGLSAIDFRRPQALDQIYQLELDNPIGRANPRAAKQLETAKARAQNYGASGMEKERLATVALAARANMPIEELGTFDGDVFIPDREKIIRTEIRLEQEEKEKAEAAPKLNQISKEINEIEEKRMAAVSEFNAEKNKTKKETWGRNIAEYDAQLIRRNNQMFEVDPVLKKLPRVESEDDLEKVNIGEQFVAVGARGRLTVRTKQEIPEEPVTPTEEGGAAATPRPQTLEERLEQKGRTAPALPSRGGGRGRRRQGPSEKEQLESRKNELESLLYRQTGRGRRNLRPTLSTQDPDVRAALEEIESIDQRLKNL